MPMLRLRHELPLVSDLRRLELSSNGMYLESRRFGSSRCHNCWSVLWPLLGLCFWTGLSNFDQSYMSCTSFVIRLLSNESSNFKKSMLKSGYVWFWSYSIIAGPSCEKLPATWVCSAAIRVSRDLPRSMCLWFHVLLSYHDPCLFLGNKWFGGASELHLRCITSFKPIVQPFCISPLITVRLVTLSLMKLFLLGRFDFHDLDPIFYLKLLIFLPSA